MAVSGSFGKPVIKPVPPTADGEKTLVRDISFCGVPENGSNASMVDVKDGKIVRIRPMHYLWKYKEKELNPWKMTVRGSTFEPSLKTLLPPYSLRTRNVCTRRPVSVIPMKRVDWDPNGERNPQNRGKSKYVRISWDEALNFIVGEMNRLKAKYGPTCSSLPVRSARREQGSTSGSRRGPQAAPAVGRIHAADPAARQLGRLVVGQQALLGL